MRIEPLSQNEVETQSSRIKELLRQSYVVSFPNMRLEDQYFNEKVLQLSTFVAEEKAIVLGAFDPELIGFIWGYVRCFVAERRLHINHLVVDRNYRGQGIGSMLVNSIEDYVQQKGISTIDLMVSANSPAVKFYSRIGFLKERYQMVKKLGGK
ncbi:hypothetical protein TSYNTROOL_19710 [Tepidanaerobacter syntrophicus]|uniref:GNAT family N-acetyltransferase n=1 Tax=Tepidanaerobacter syntrophicus TaxID=224999 RepID=UPI0022EDC048|nr:GNAT family N-acetyltransferase [Tepidanaerobacter syntrophicus]GLI51885.1 hypothetical protein TSYNTROOL_19710 [Tepidanaerobacter syntrophicus]